MIRDPHPLFFRISYLLLALTLAFILFGCEQPEARPDTRVHTATCRTVASLLENRPIPAIHSYARPHRVCGQPDEEDS